MIRYICTNKYAFFSEFIQRSITITFLDYADAFVAVTISVKGVGFAVDHCPYRIGVGVGCSAAIVTGAKVVLRADIIGNPCAQSDCIFTEGKGDTIDDCLSINNQLLGGGISVHITVNVAVGQLPAGHGLACDCVVIGFAILDNTAAGFLMLAYSANEEAFGVDGVDMSAFDLLAPVDDRLTGFTVGSVLVAILSAGGFLAGNSQFFIVIMPGNDIIVDFGFYGFAAVEGQHLAVHGLDPAVAHIVINGNDGAVAGLELGLTVDDFAGNGVHTIPGPDAHRQADQRACAFQSVVGLSQSDGDNIVHIMDVGGAAGKGGVTTVTAQQFAAHNFETIGNRQVFQFPGVCSVEHDVGFKFLDIFNIVGLQVYIVDGVILGRLTAVVMTANVYQRILFVKLNGELNILLGEVAGLVGDFEGHDMGFSVQSRIFGGCQNGTIYLAVEFNTVQIDLSGVKIQADCSAVDNIRNRGGETGAGGIDHGGAVFVQRNGFVCRNNIDLSAFFSADDGCIAVRRNRAVVQSEVIEVEDQILGSIRLDVVADEAGGTRTILIFIRVIQSDIIAQSLQINSKEHPTGIRNVGFRHAVQILSCSARSLGEEMAAGSFQCSKFSRVFINFCSNTLELHGQTGCAFRNVYPHAQVRRVLSISRIAQDNRFLTDVVEHIVGPACVITGIVVQLNAQGVFVVLYLSIFFTCQEYAGIGIIGEVAGRIVENRRLNALFIAPLSECAGTQEIGDVAIFKVPVNLRALAVADLEHRCLHVAIHVGGSNCYAILAVLFACGRELCFGNALSDQRAGSIIGKRPGECVGREVDCRSQLVLGSVHFHFDFHGLAEGQNRFFNGKSNGEGIDYMEVERISELTFFGVLSSERNLRDTKSTV